MGKRNLTEEFKAEAVQLILAQGYSVTKVCEALDVGDSALRHWVALWRAQQAEPPRSDVQIQNDQRRIRQLEARVIELKREREILKNIPRGALRPKRRNSWVALH
ncbi:transposase [Paraburkholderia sp. RL17-347-BIC-D]|jgi:transposase|uniref:transposase n=1 Tax=Paraburkholderia sp. RL17-347-BIC-D TaxID=3031632 RepID=UPI0038BA6802